MISSDEVKEREDGGSKSGGGEGMDVGKRVSIVRCGHVQLPIVLAGTPTTISLGNHVEWGSPGTARRANDTQIHHLLELLPGNVQLLAEKAPGSGIDSWDPIKGTPPFTLMSVTDALRGTPF